MEIYVLDNDINILGVFSTYEAVIWNPKLHQPGTFKAQFVFSDKMNRILQRGNLLYKNDEDEPAIITRKNLQLNKRGEQYITVQGYMASRYLNQRIIWSKMLMSGTPEQIMRQMVQEQVVSPVDDARKMPRVTLGDFKDIKQDEIEKQITYDNLQEALTAVATAAELGYRLRLDIAAKIFTFEVYQGVNRTLGTEQPCIFTRDFGNVYTQTYAEDNTNYRNICLVGGPGEDADRILKTVGNATGIERYEMFYNASGISQDKITESELYAQLEQKGKEKLAAYYTAAAFESKINQQKAMPFALGDYVTCTDSEWGVTVNTQVKEIEKGYSKKEESFIATFGDDVPTLVDLIKAKE